MQEAGIGSAGRVLGLDMAIRGMRLEARDWMAVSTEEADLLAWQAICDWPAAAGFDPVVDGIDYSLLARFHLRHKVGRAVRRMRDPEEGRFEESAARNQRRPEDATGESGERAPAPESRWEWLKRSVRPLFGWVFPGENGGQADRGRGEVDPGGICIPLAHRRWEKTLPAIHACGLRVAVGDGLESALGSDEGSAAREAERPFARRLSRAIGRGLECSGVALAGDDMAILEEELLTSRARVLLAERQLGAVIPRLLVTFADDHPPSMEFVLVARRLGVPSLMIQHGLDCEHLTLDQAFADHIAVWGPEREERYRRRSHWQPLSIGVTGNPEYDTRGLPTSLSVPGSTWLWVTRPHTSEKCYLPSRSTREGLQILEALTAVVAERPQVRLTIRPHPFDYAHLYAAAIEEIGLAERVSLSGQPLDDLLPRASVVFSEDSTAGMEAMFLGRPLVHVHFSTAPRSMPFVDYEAALPAFDIDGLRESIAALDRPAPSDQARMLAGQRRFLRAHCGPCDGRSAERLIEFTKAVLMDSVSRPAQTAADRRKRTE